MISFSNRLIKWHKKSGRKNLPWQIKTTPYKVWISEIMLQQTQVNTVKPYFKRFIERYPSVTELAMSTQEEIMTYWSGLGYYSRAKNIHLSSLIITERFKGLLPMSLDDLINLPGIGRSTAGAIMSLGHKKSAPILDANARRVLCRYKAIKGDLFKSKTNKELWTIAESLLPKENGSIYTQALMDLGATICLQKNPKCLECPINKICLAKKENLIHSIPQKKIRKLKPIKEVYWLIIRSLKGEYLLTKRPNTGIWPGLWSFFQFNDLTEIATSSKILKDIDIKKEQEYKLIKHTFSHYTLHAKLIYIDLKKKEIQTSDKLLWLNVKNIEFHGLPTPVKKTIVELSSK